MQTYVPENLRVSFLQLFVFWHIFYLQIQAGGGGSYQDHSVDLDESKHIEEFFTFITRPDLTVPRWNVNVYDESRISPGYWFTSPYNTMKQTKPGAHWNAPYIYDSMGELIWTGYPTFEGWSTFDFRVLDVMGRPMLGLINYHEGNAWILDETYSVFKTIPVRNNITGLINIHEFVTVDNGTKALYLTYTNMYASEEESKAIGFDGRCFVKQAGFNEVQIAAESSELAFSWISAHHIGLNESYDHEQPVNDRCANSEKAWDFVHMNSVDKFPDGDYLVSGRRTFALYKVSRIDGSIVWRLGGKRSDFEVDIEFSGQHAARVHDQNETHTIISFFDNAFFKDYMVPTHENSRGVLLALHTSSRPMRAETLATFDHPEKLYTPARGNFEILTNGNVWNCWAHGSMHTEHAVDGSLIMKARFRPELSSYRSFKSEWHARPRYPPDVRAFAVAALEGERIVSKVYVSWNGATEVVRWKVWRTDSGGRLLELAAEAPRRGFETVITTTKHADHVLVEGLNRYGRSLGKSNVVQTMGSDNDLGPAGTVLEKGKEDHAAAPHKNLPSINAPRQNSSRWSIYGFVLTAAVLLIWVTKGSDGASVLLRGVVQKALTCRGLET